MSEERSGWLPVVEAAQAAGVPERTAFRWAREKKISSRVEKGVTLVEVEVVRAFAATRAAAKAGLPAAAGTPAGSGSGGGSVAAAASGTDGETAALVISRFEEGASPIDIVKELRLLPERVRALHRDWLALRESDRSSPSATDRIAALEQRVGLLETSCASHDTLTAVDNQLRLLRDHVTDLPIPSARQVECRQCRSRGLVAVQMICTVCRHSFVLGFFPSDK